MRVDDWIQAVITTSNLLGRLEVGSQRNELDDESRQLLADMRGDLRFSDDFRTWYGELGCRAVVDGVLTKDGRHWTPAAATLIRIAEQTSRGEAVQTSLEEYGELLKPQVETFLRDPANGLKLLPGSRSAWDAILDLAALDAIARDFELRLGKGTAVERLGKLLLPSCLRQLELQDVQPVSLNLALLLMKDARSGLCGALGCQEDQLISEIITRSRRSTRGRSAKDLLAAEQMKVMISDLVQATSDAVLSILNQAQESGLADRTIIDCQLAAMIALKHNYREAVEPLLGSPDVRGRYSAESQNQILSLLRSLVRLRRSEDLRPTLEDSQRLAISSSLGRVIALVLEAVQFVPFGADENVDLTGGSLRVETGRRHELLPIGSEGVREPLSREDFVERMRESLKADGELHMI